MGFSQEWEELYKAGRDKVRWPWSDIISLSKHYCRLKDGVAVLELGVGSGANVPFFINEGTDFYGIDGSKTIIEELSSRFKDDHVHFICADFTKSIPLETKFDLIVDRASITCNTTQDIISTIRLMENVIKPGGIFIGVEWFSVNSNLYTDGYEYEQVDEFSRIYHSGYFKGKGIKHFCDLKQLQNLFDDKWEFLYASETTRKDYILQEGHSEGFDGWWNFVCKRK